MNGHASGWTFQRATAIGTNTSAPKRITIVVVAVRSRAATTIRFHSAWMNAAARTMRVSRASFAAGRPAALDQARAAVGVFATTSAIRSSASFRLACEFA